MGAETKDFFNLSKNLLQAVDYMKRVSFLVIAVSGCTIQEKPSINLQ
jgi:hypothetical protein